MRIWSKLELVLMAVDFLHDELVAEPIVFLFWVISLEGKAMLRMCFSSEVCIFPLFFAWGEFWDWFISDIFAVF